MSSVLINEPNSSMIQNRHRLSKMLQLHGYSACREALVLLEDHYSSSTKYESMEDFINKLNTTITFHTSAHTSIIDPDLAYLVIQKLSNSDNKQQVVDVDDDVHQDDINVQSEQESLPIDLAIKIKNVQCEIKKSSSSQKQSFNSELLINEYNIHYNYLYKRLNSLPIFQGDFKLMDLATLTASNKPSIRCVCFGLLTKDLSKIDGYLLIDSTGRVPVRITPDTTYRNRLAYLNCIVLVEGVYINPDDILFAANIGLPPVLLDPLRDKALICRDEKLVVILRELYLDDEDVCNMLDLLFTGYNSMEDPPLLFILIGDFSREPCDLSSFKTLMKKLIRILRSCDNLKKSHFVLVPGQHDTSPLETTNNLHTLPPSKPTLKMPKPPLSREQAHLNLFHLANMDNVHLATNPAYIHLDDRIISVISYSHMKELRKNLLHDMSDHREELFDTVKQIMLSNAHFTAGIDRGFHSSMNLWHRPDLLVLADTEAFGNKYDYSSSSQNDTSFSTIPSFSRQSFQFKVYYLKTGELEDSQVSSDALESAEDEDDDEEATRGNEVVDLIEEEQRDLD